MGCSLQLKNLHPTSVQPHKKLPKNSTALKLTLTTLVVLGICFIPPPQLFFHCRVCIDRPCPPPTKLVQAAIINLL